MRCPAASGSGWSSPAVELEDGLAQGGFAAAGLAHKADDLPLLHGKEKIQIIFQDPYAALNPKKKVLQSVMAPLDVTLP